MNRLKLVVETKKVPHGWNEEGKNIQFKSGEVELL